jgi:protein TonB
MTLSFLRLVPGVPPVALALAACLALALPIAAQNLDQGVIIQQGTQFVKPPAEPQQAPAPAQPTQQQSPAAPTPAAAQPPPAAPPVPPAPPARFPQVVFLLDTSDSMLDPSPSRDGTNLDAAKTALKKVIAGMPVEARVQLWTFATGLTKLSLPGETRGGFVPVGAPDSPMRKQIAAEVNAIKTAGGTNLYTAVIKTLALFGAPQDQAAYRSGQRFPVLVVISDGEDWGKSRDTFEAVQAAKAKYPLVTINAIGFTVSENDKWFPQLCKLTAPSGRCATAGDQERLQAILESFYRAS